MSDDTIKLKEPSYTCLVHGNIGQYVLVSTIPEYEMKLCLKCYLSKLKEIGVCEIKEAQS